MFMLDDATNLKLCKNRAWRSGSNFVALFNIFPRRLFQISATCCSLVGLRMKRMMLMPIGKQIKWKADQRAKNHTNSTSLSLTLYAMTCWFYVFLHMRSWSYRSIPGAPLAAPNCPGCWQLLGFTALSACDLTEEWSLSDLIQSHPVKDMSGQNRVRYGILPKIGTSMGNINGEHDDKIW